MDEFSLPPAVEMPTQGSLADIAMRNAIEAPERVLYSRKVDTRWRDVTAGEFWAEVLAVAKGLVAAGVQSGDRVALMARTRYEWTLLDFALWTSGAVVVPVYETSSAEQVQWILQDSGAVGIVVETVEHAMLVESVRAETPACRHVWTIDDDAVADLAKTGVEVSDGDIEERRRGLSPDALATIIYTSGTTGRPKGCELTHGNCLFVMETATKALEDLFDEDDASTLLFIPLAHVFARLVQIACASARIRLGHAPTVTTLSADLADFQPTFLFSVPRVFEKVYNSASQKAHAGGKGFIFDRAATVAIEYSKAQERGSVGLLLTLQYRLFDRLVYGKLRAALGGKAKYAISGGAALGERLGHFFHGIGLLVLEGYGLTETSAPSTVNLPDAMRIGTVGRPMPGTAVRIAEDGEILLAGPHIFRGYFNNPDATAEAIDPDGWFHSGDIGELDADGYLRITGRKKDIIVTAGGKNVAPAVLEDRIRAHHLVSQCMVVGDARPFIGALITLDPEALPAWAEQHGKDPNDLAGLATDPILNAEVDKAVREANQAVSKAESIKKFTILEVDWTEAEGHLTPSMKLKRATVLKEHEAEVDALYA